MATQKPVEKDPELQIEEALSKSEQYIQKNGKKYLIAIAVIAMIVGGFFGYNQFYAEPLAEEASEEMFNAQIQFERDSFAVALNGVDGVFLGFDNIMTDYASTPQGNLAAHYAGICAMRLGNFDEAIKYFNSYEAQGSTVGEIIDAQNVGLIGDCNMELGKVDEAISFYKKAMEVSASDATAPLYAQKAAIALYSQGKFADAKAVLVDLKANYPNSTQSRDADKYITLVEQAL